MEIFTTTHPYPQHQTKTRSWDVALEVLTAVVSVFRDMRPCSPLKVNRRYGGTCRFHLQGWRTSQERNQLATCFRAGFLLGLFFDTEDGGDMFFRFHGLYGVISRKTGLFMVMGVISFDIICCLDKRSTSFPRTDVTISRHIMVLRHCCTLQPQRPQFHCRKNPDDYKRKFCSFDRAVVGDDTDIR
jgi:hypothetical protein